jgi:orotidine-5'-phosphate decarboxylase
MGRDSIDPFLEFKDKWAIILALTSNKSAKDIQSIKNLNGEQLYESIIKNSTEWSSKKNMMYVVGANREDDLLNIRKIIPDNFLLIPGVGAQGGDLKKISNLGMNKNCGIIVNVSRSIIYCDDSINFGQEVRLSAMKVKNQMQEILFSSRII